MRGRTSSGMESSSHEVCFSNIGIFHPLEAASIVTSSNGWIWVLVCLWLFSCNGHKKWKPGKLFPQQLGEQRFQAMFSYFATFTKETQTLRTMSYRQRHMKQHNRREVGPC